MEQESAVDVMVLVKTNMDSSD